MSRRVRILCEDRLAERFLRKLCERFGVTVVDVQVAPVGRGAASAWVSTRYADLVRARRAKNFQHGLGLLVHVDGDNLGVAVRQAELDGRLAADGQAKRQPEEPVAVLVPTWCTETWLLHLAGLAQPDESDQLKRPPFGAFEHAIRLLQVQGRTALVLAAQAWNGLETGPPSLVAGRVEARRVGIG